MPVFTERHEAEMRIDLNGTDTVFVKTTTVLLKDGVDHSRIPPHIDTFLTGDEIPDRPERGLAGARLAQVRDLADRVWTPAARARRAARAAATSPTP